MSRPINITDTISAYPSSLDTEHSVYASITDTEDAYDSSSSSTYARIDLVTGSNANTYAFFNFDLDIPAGATISSVACTAKAYVSSTSTNRITNRQIQLFSGTTAKGSASTISTSTTAITMTTGTWTAVELQNAKIRIWIQRGTNSTTSTSYYGRFYGATFTVTYSLSGTEYSITAASAVQSITVSPSSQYIMQGENTTITFDVDDISDYLVTDNNVDVTNLLVRHTKPTGGTEEKDLGTYALVSGSFNGSGASYFAGLTGHGVDATKTTSNYYSSGSGTIAVFTYDMSFDNIPSNAIITNVYCEVNGHAESTSNSNEYMCVRLISGSTNLTDEINFKSIGTSNSTVTLTPATMPTVAQLESMKLQCRLGYYGGAINGATAYVTYTMPASAGSHYYEYTLTNINADHVILIEEDTEFIPPEEDPIYTYWPITISSINATTNPTTGTIRVVEGSNQTITIEPSDPLLTLALDNGNDVTSQLVGGVVSNTYTVTTKKSGATYGFNLNNNTGYYVSSNNGVSKSASVATVNFDFDTDCLVTFEYINYAEAQYDYGMFGKVDTNIAVDGLTAGSGGSSPSDSSSNYQYMCSTTSDNTNTVKTLTYTIPAGNHFIDVKYGKDDASDSGNDNLQWKIASITSISGGGSYTYTLSNITEKHSLIFVFGNVSFYYITSSGSTGMKLFPDGQQVKLEGDGYRIVAVPENNNDIISLFDNGTNVTAALTSATAYDKNNNPVVSYTYQLSNIHATHNLVFTSDENPDVNHFWVKQNNTWREVTAIYQKINGTWVQQGFDFFDKHNINIKQS